VSLEGVAKTTYADVIKDRYKIDVSGSESDENLVYMPIDLQKLREAVRNQTALSPVSERKLSEVEHQLGFALPPLLRTIYLEISGGGFGPGYGFYGVIKGTKTFPKDTIVSSYLGARRSDPDDPSFSWPPLLLPLVNWGCLIESCVDCSSSSYPIIRFDPNLEAKWQFQPENFTFEGWMQAWLDGRDLWRPN